MEGEGERRGGEARGEECVGVWVRVRTGWQGCRVETDGEEIGCPVLTSSLWLCQHSVNELQNQRE